MPRKKAATPNGNVQDKTISANTTPNRRSKRAAPIPDEAPITPPPPKRSKRASATTTPKYKDPSDDESDLAVEELHGAIQATKSTIQKSSVKKEVKVEEEEEEEVKAKPTPKRTPKKRKAETADRVETPKSSQKKVKIDDEPISPPASSKKKTKKPTSVNEDTPKPDAPADENPPTSMRKSVQAAAITALETAKPPKKPRAPRKTAEQKAFAALPLASRTPIPTLALSSTSTPKRAHYIGAHVSGAGGVHNALTNALHIGSHALALFLKSQRKWENPPLKPEVAVQFRELATQHVYSPAEHVLPHGSYLVNLAAAEEAKAEQAYAAFADDMRRCRELGIGLYNFHPGNTNGRPRAEAIGRIAEKLNRVHKEVAPTGKGEVATVTLLENMAAASASNTIGGTFEDLRDVIDLVEDKSRVGVCFDTCHGFAAGYDIRTPEKLREVFERFDEVVGARYLRAVHVNDSKGMLGSNRDLHQNIGAGFLGLRAFHALMNEERFRGIPLVLETPIDKTNENGKEIEDKNIWATEIKLLESLVGMDAESEEFKKLEKDLAAKGEKERSRLAEQFQRKLDKSPKKRKVKEETSDEE